MGRYSRGTTTTFSLAITNENTGLPIDADSTPIAKVYTTSDELVATLTVAPNGTGLYSAPWSIDVAQSLGTYKCVWTFNYNSKPYKKWSIVEVYE
jgi:hypothetical protein